MALIPINRWSSVEIISECDVLDSAGNINPFHSVTSSNGLAHRWKIKLKAVDSLIPEIKKLNAFVAKHKGRLLPLELLNPEITHGQGGGSPKLQFKAEWGDDEIQVMGLPRSVNAVWAAGDFIHLSGHIEVFQVAEDVDSTAGGTAAVKLVNWIRRPYPADTTIQFGDEVVFTVRNAQDTNRLVNSAQKSGYTNRTFVFNSVDF